MSENWMKDTMKVKILNLEHPGDQVYIGCQGVSYLYDDGQIVVVPKLVVEAIKSCVVKDWKISGEMGKKVQVPVDRARFMAIPIPDEDTEKVLKEPSIKEKTEKSKAKATEILDGIV